MSASPLSTAELTTKIVGFLVAIGIPVTEAELTTDGFLPGILVRDGGLTVDRARLRHPGDLLHEAGHLAVLDPAARRRFGAPQGLAGHDMGQLEIAAVGWSYAAARHLDLDLDVVFHAGGYAGRGPALVRSFAYGVHVGVADLEAAGLTVTLAEADRRGIAPYPHMIRWLRD
jgi:hypothetical protein